MDQALKQRLVGATVLIALGIILLPMLLSGQPDLQNESARIEVPDKPPELSMETRRFPVGDSPQATSQPEDAEWPAGEDPPAPTAPVDRAVRPAPSGSEPGDAAAPISDPGRYLVQVASFSNPGNANSLAGVLRENRLPVLMDAVVTAAGRLHRVRVGPFNALAEADDSVRQIRALMSDLNPRVVDLRPEEGAPVTDPSDPMVRWAVQAGSFSEQNNADDLVARLRQSGFAAYGESVSSGADTVYKVKVGPVIERESAVALAAKLRTQLGIDGLIMSVD